ncbi:MAG: SIS domain-containing protein [Pseudomonadota bacterium]|nr:SIS domain-containing protein [Pseudomonadota bacterium]
MSNAENKEVLSKLYPFLHDRKQDPELMNKALLESVRQKVASHQEVIAQFCAQHAQAIVSTAGAIAQVYRTGGRLYTMGNGGSSCDAAHVAVEFLHPVTAGRPALTAVDLTADRTMLTAVANDVGYAHVFVRQIIAQGRAGDGLIGLSTSGGSENLVKAFRKAKEMGLVTIGLTGMSGGEMATMGLDHCLVVGSGSIHRIQECHVLIYHMLWDLVHTLLADDRGNLSIGKAEALAASESELK